MVLRGALKQRATDISIEIDTTKQFVRYSDCEHDVEKAEVRGPALDSCYSVLTRDRTLPLDINLDSHCRGVSGWPGRSEERTLLWRCSEWSRVNSMYLNLCSKIKCWSPQQRNKMKLKSLSLSRTTTPITMSLRTVVKSRSDSFVEAKKSAMKRGDPAVLIKN